MSDPAGLTEFQKSTQRRLLRIEKILDRLKFQAGSGSGPGGGKAVVYATFDSTNPPTETELEAAFGSPAAHGTNFLGLLNDAATGLSEYIVMCDGTSFAYQALTKPITGPPLPPEPAANADLTYVFAGGKLARARNFVTGGTSVHWQNATGATAGTGTGTAFALDPPGHKDAAYRAYGDVLEHTSDLDSTIPSWASVLTAADIQTAMSVSSVVLQRLATSKVEPGLVYVASTSATKVVISASTDYGANWAHHFVDVGGTCERIIADPVTPGKVWFCGENAGFSILQVSFDYGATWTGVVGPAFQHVDDFDVDPTTGQVVIVRVSIDHLYYSHTAEAGFGVLVGDTVATPGGGNRGTMKMSISAQDPDDVLWIETYTPYHSTDGGVSYSPLSPIYAASSCPDRSILAVSRWPYDDTQVFWLFCPGGVSPPTQLIGYSSDLLASIQNKVGDWTAEMGAPFDNPVMIAPVSLI